MSHFKKTILGTLQQSGVRDQLLDNQNYLVAPVIMLVEGVHAGNMGPLYYPIDEMKANIELWNGRPVVIDHPMLNGQPVTANHPQVIEKQGVGQLFNTVFVDGKLKSEVWINIEKAELLSPGLVSLIRTNGQLEVSTGLFMEEELVPGEWNGEQYIGIARNLRADHFALLPGGIGACSWDDGCGVRANEAANTSTQNKSRQDSAEREVASVDTKLSPLDTAMRWLRKTFTDNELSHDDVHQALRNAIREATPDNMSVWLKEVFDNYVVYELEERTDGMPSGPEKLYKRSYMVDTQGVVSLGSDAIEVREESNYVPVVPNTLEQETTAENAVKEDNDVERTAVVAALVACERTKFTEADTDWLNKLEVCQLEKLQVPEPVATNTQTDPPKETKTDPVETAPKGDPPVEDKIETVESYLENAPPEIQQTLNRAIAREKRNTDVLVKELLANKRNKFTEEKLRSMSIEDLEGLTELANITVDFSGAGGGPTENEDDGVIPPAQPVWNLDAEPKQDA